MAAKRQKGPSHRALPSRLGGGCATEGTGVTDHQSNANFFENASGMRSVKLYGESTLTPLETTTMPPSVAKQERSPHLLAVVTGTILDHEILRGEFYCFPVPIGIDDAEFMVRYFRDVEDYERGLSRAWAECNNEPEVIRLCGLAVRLAFGPERKLRNSRCWASLDAQAPALTFNLGSQVTSQHIVDCVNAAATKMLSAV